ncbi:MAG: SDR family oxidoreductase [Pelobium sp.]
MTDQFNLKNKVIVVTGATGVLGKSFVKAISNSGGIVGVMGRNQAVAEERVAEIIGDGGEAIALIADVTNEEQLVEAKSKLLAKYGKVDGLVNAAGGNMPGGILQPEADIFGMSMAGMKEVMDLNVWGTLLPTQIFGVEIAKHKGSIVNISSMSSQQAITKVLGYSMAKAAIDCYTRWFSVELAKRYGDKLRMNAIAPGFFLTEQNRTLLTKEDGSYTDRGNLVLNNTPFNRFGAPEELTGCLVWLLSEASSFVSGTTINIDGGFSIYSGV